jgi:hypothetical protein
MIETCGIKSWTDVLRRSGSPAIIVGFLDGPPGDQLGDYDVALDFVGAFADDH